MKKKVLIISGIFLMLIFLTVDFLKDNKIIYKIKEINLNGDNPNIYSMYKNEEIFIDVNGEVYSIKLLKHDEEKIICPSGEECRYVAETRALLKINGKEVELKYITNPMVQLGETNQYFRFQGSYTGSLVFFETVPVEKGEGYIIDNHVYFTKEFYERGIHKDSGITPDAPGNYYYIAMGQQPSNGYRILIEEVIINGNKAEVTVREVKPGPNDDMDYGASELPVCLLILDTPMDIIVKNQDGEVFEKINFE